MAEIVRAEEAARVRPVLWRDFPWSRTLDAAYLPAPLNADTGRWVWRTATSRFTRPGFWFLVATALVAMAGSSSLEVQFYVPALYLLGMWLPILIACRAFRPHVSLKAEHVRRIAVGEVLEVDVEVRQEGRLGFVPVTVVPHRLPSGLQPVPHEGAIAPPLRRGQTASVRLSLACRRRGLHSWRGFRAETDYPFGMVRSHQTHTGRNQVLVYPRFTPMVGLKVPAGRRYHPGGVALASELGEAFEYIGNRPYREGDSVRRIDWRATARLGEPIVREYREEYFMRVGVVLDTHVPTGDGPAASENFERAVSTCAAVGDFMARSDYIVDIFAAGPTLYHLTAGRSLAYLDQILDILACVDESEEEPFEVLEPEILRYLSRITTIICVFVDWSELRQGFVDRLRREGAGVKVIVVRDAPCTMDPAGYRSLPIPVVSAAMFEAGVREL